jgi:gliding motility-associated-like protein
MSNDIILSVRPNLAAAVTVIQNPSGAICSGTAVTFTATPINGGTTPSYAWYVNGGTNAVATGDTFTTSTLLNNDVITVRMLSTENCTSNNPATSAPIRVSVIPSVAPSVSIVASANPICSGTAVTFTATPTNGGTLPQYQWYLNGTPIAGEVTNRYVTTALVDNDEISVEITNTNVCGGKSLSNVIIMTVNPLPEATLTGGTTICKDATAPILTFTGSNGIAPYTFTYTLNNGPVQTITTTGGNTAQIQVPTSATGVYVYRLISVTASSTPACSKTITGQQQTVIVDGVPATVTIVTNTTTICPGSSVTFVANTTNAGTNPTYQWLLNTSTVVGTDPTFTSSTLRNNDVLNVIMTSSSACATNNPVTSPGVQIRVTPSVTPLVNIVADKNNICTGTSVRFTATPTNGGTNPIYIWKKNTVAVQSGASATFTTTSLGNNDVITVEMTSNQACVINNPAVSNAITMVVSPTLATSISISGENVICAGRTVDFIANGVNVGSAPTYQWFIGTRLVGTNSANFSSNTLQNGDVVRCTVINTENCFTGSPATSNLITMTVNPVITPTVTIIADKTAICKGSCVLFTARPVNGGAAVQYQWFLNDTPIAFANSITYTSCALVNNDRIYVEITNPTVCAGSSRSNVITVSVTDLPTATITTNSTGTCINGVQPEVTLTGFGGIAPYTFTYTVNGNLRTIRTTSTSDSVVIKVATTTAGTFNYSLVSVTSGNTLACTQAQTGTVSVTVEAVPFAPNVTLTQPTCTVGGTITVTAPTGAGFFYSIDGVDYTNSTGTFTNLGGGLYQVTYQNANGCISLPRAVRINDNGKPVPTPQDGAICFDASGAVINPYVLDSNLSPLNYDFVWTFNGNIVGTQSTYTATAIGTYTVVATSKITGCVSDPITATVAAAQSPTVTATISAAFTDNASITVNTTPAGNYQYQLDQGPFQSSNVFTNVSAGEHTVTVITDACQPVIVNVSLINYPNYFTPNGDGIHDTWNVIGLKNQLIKQISPVGDGWDGTFNSENLPSTDYWFTVDYIDTNTGSNKVFRSHFSLKR